LSPQSPLAAQKVYLRVPYAEKEQAKRHGARWNPERRLWWICRNDIAIHPGVYRWMEPSSPLATKARGADKFLRGQQPGGKRNRKPQNSRAPVLTQCTDFSLSTCQCSTPPWEDCEHTVAPMHPLDASQG
jgi:Domain of unknown function (DUF5710)